MKDQIVFHCRETVMMSEVETTNRKFSWTPPIMVEAGKSYLIEIDEFRLIVQEVAFVKTLLEETVKRPDNVKPN